MKHTQMILKKWKKKKKKKKKREREREKKKNPNKWAGWMEAGRQYANEEREGARTLSLLFRTVDRMRR